jgi:excisionase family DNA binding protein
MEKLYTIPEAAEYLGVTRQAVYKWMRQGRLRFVLVGADRRVPESALRAFVKPGSTRPQQGDLPDESNIQQETRAPSLAVA